MKVVSKERIKILLFALFMFLVLLSTKVDCQLMPRPFRPVPPPNPVTQRSVCSSQFNLVNYACAMLPYSQAPPLPPPQLTPSPPHDDNSGHGHRHRHRHRRDHGSPATPEEENCCRWLKNVDNECVCDLLVRLPIFLARPVHEYTVIVDDSCNVTYTCPGRLIT